MREQPSIEQQKAAWSQWASTTRERRLTEISLDQRELTLTWLTRTAQTNLDILDVGCGPAWLAPHLKAFGNVTAIDLADDVIERARGRIPGVEFIAADFMAFDFEERIYDVVVTLEVLAHVADQAAFLAKIAHLLKPGGMLVLATQNRHVLEQHNRVPAPIPGQIRQWVDQTELVGLLQPHFTLVELRTITPQTNKGPWRLVNNTKANWVLKRAFGDAPKRLKERLGLGWTLMTLAQRR